MAQDAREEAEAMDPRSKLMKVASIAIVIGSTAAAILNSTAGGSVFPYALMAVAFSVGMVVDSRRERRAE
ncbi:hypothetical protein [Erythrobacter sp.]|uniref:hypothetical protein n=1 Tax=Erythrobacter sp. TaxID=1042 RepID=UPI001425D33F|nr:hypothetical protein [Erythrobacter sp.]QIQ86488.1 MAG: hypothetical protein G9473_07140 [Erythrobacter sp.]